MTPNEIELLTDAKPGDRITLDDGRVVEKIRSSTCVKCPFWTGEFTSGDCTAFPDHEFCNQWDIAFRLIGVDEANVDEQTNDWGIGK